MPQLKRLGAVAVALLASACIGGPEGDGATSALAAGLRCEVTGDGTLATGDAFAGAFTVDLTGTAAGAWDHWTPEVVVPGGDDHPGRGCERRRGGDDHPGRGHPDPDDFEHPGGGCDGDGDSVVRDHFEGTVEAASCHPNGFLTFSASGSGTWNGDVGYTFLIEHAQDRGAAVDYYNITITDPDGVTITHAVAGDLASGDIVGDAI